MKGVIFTLLEQVVARRYGEEAWDGLLDAAQLEGAYTTVGTYPDEDLLKLVRAASARLHLPPEEVIRWFGNQAIPLLAESFPQFFKPHESALPFLLTLNDIIHAEVRKLYPGADIPVFEFERPARDVLVLKYKSKRKLCALAEGLIQGAAAQYGERVEIEQPQCMNRGDDACYLRCRFSGSGSAAS